MIELKNIGVTFQQNKKDFQAVKNVNLTIEEGEIFGIVGPSGAGKSTLVRVINLLQPPTSGQELIEGNEITSLKRKELCKVRLDIGMIFQHFNLISGSTIAENVAFALHANHYPKEKIQGRVKELLEMVHLPEKADSYPANLSGGQKQRVAIGSVIVRQPKAYLMDEPLSNLDAKLRSQMRVELSKLHRELGATVIYVTHDQVEAMTLGTRIVVMKSGKIQQAATPGDLYQNPVNKFVAGFIGSPAMNFLPVWVERRDERVCLEFGSSRLYVNRMCASRLIEGGYMGRRVYLGIRPEDFHETGPGENALLFEVEIREMLGAEQLLYGNSGRNELCVRMKPEFKAEPGSTVTVFVDMDRIKLFDMETEDNILYL